MDRNRVVVGSWQPQHSTDRRSCCMQQPCPAQGGVQVLPPPLALLGQVPLLWEKPVELVQMLVLVQVLVQLAELSVALAELVELSVALAELAELFVALAELVELFVVLAELAELFVALAELAEPFVPLSVVAVVEVLLAPPV